MSPKNSNHQAHKFFTWKTWATFVLVVLFFNALLVFNQFILIRYFAPGAEVIKKSLYSQPFYARGIYISSWTAATSNQLAKLVDFAKQNQINALVIDLKDSLGKITYDSQVPLVKELQTSEDRIKNFSSALDGLHQKGFYLIARLPVFEDKELANKKSEWAIRDRRTGRIWQDNKGLSWVDPSSTGVWDYNLDIAKEAFDLGFDEVNFDYVRFPSDGSISNLVYPVWDQKVDKSEIIRQFFAYQKDRLAQYGARSVDLFGMSLWFANENNDMNIGQRLINALPYFDYVCPMVYPSHYPANFDGFANPANYPYEVIFNNFKKAQLFFAQQKQQQEQAQQQAKASGQKIAPPVETARIRPWLQAFNLGATYNLNMIEKEIKATDDGGGFGWLLWNAANNYSSFSGYQEEIKK
jgi:hypothetical protein